MPLRNGKPGNTRTYQVTDDGDAFDLALFEGDDQVAGAIIPLGMGLDAAFELAQILGETFATGERRGPPSHLSPTRPKH